MGFIICLNIALILFVWLRLSTFVEYIKLTKPTKRFFNIEEFEGSGFDTYPEYLHNKYNNFFTKLLKCPFCMAFWLGILFWVLGFIKLIYILPVTLLSSIVYMLCSLLFNKYLEL